MRRITVLLGVSAIALAGGLSLAACSKPAGKAAAPAAAGPQAASSMAMPAPTPGLWKQSISAGGHTEDARICMDASTTSKMSMMAAGVDQTKCTSSGVYQGPDGVTFENRCDMGKGGIVTTKGVMSGDVSSHYKMSLTSTTSHGTSTSTVDAVREGDCPAGWKGGDMEVHGMKINLLEAEKKAEQLRGLSGKVKLN